MKDKKTFDYTRIYYKLEEILAEKDSIEELEKEGYGKDGLYQACHPTLKYKLVRMVDVLKEEKIDDINEMMKIMMQVTKGRENPKMILNVLQEELGDKNEDLIL